MMASDWGHARKPKLAMRAVAKSNYMAGQYTRRTGFYQEFGDTAVAKAGSFPKMHDSKSAKHAISICTINLYF